MLKANKLNGPIVQLPPIPDHLAVFRLGLKKVRHTSRAYAERSLSWFAVLLWQARLMHDRLPRAYAIFAMR